MDDFFDQARDALINGHCKLAENAYSQLFEILEMGEEPGHLPGSPDPTDMLETDLEEVGYRVDAIVGEKHRQS
ncbi:MAG: hypothetical protein IBX64_03595, partial [Actinobacteria bacterium]|nr:hypothetical protein [Actinomycetota bacterium]